MTLRGYFLLSEAWAQQQKQEQRAQDFRFYRVIEVVTAAAGRKGKLSPGDVFTSLGELKVNEEESEEDLEESYQGVRALLSQVAHQNTPVGR